VIKTNPHAYIAHEIIKKIDLSDVPMTGVTYHLPCDSSWYKVDTTQTHYVYNGGSEERIHLVVLRGIKMIIQLFMSDELNSTTLVYTVFKIIRGMEAQSNF
jgi:hypothetical protein